MRDGPRINRVVSNTGEYKRLWQSGNMLPLVARLVSNHWGLSVSWPALAILVSPMRNDASTGAYMFVDAAPWLADHAVPKKVARNPCFPTVLFSTGGAWSVARLMSPGNNARQFSRH